MIKYGDLVQYIKENHINWNTDLFDVLRGFFESYNNKYSPPPTPSNTSIQQEIFFPLEEFKEPDDGEYTNQDLLNLFST
jgi:hypothetical protein